ncbi:hypothetical protein ABGN05_25020 [Aquibium sp. LZ166]|uniref:Uncharacterized protein n=1 Tax=Aquibium pacificus TaxID=3153579 RepID=A0ABV3SR13_9HYPH
MKSDDEDSDLKRGDNYVRRRTGWSINVPASHRRNKTLAYLKSGREIFYDPREVSRHIRDLAAISPVYLKYPDCEPGTIPWVDPDELTQEAAGPPQTDRDALEGAPVIFHTPSEDFDYEALQEATERYHEELHPVPDHFSPEFIENEQRKIAEALGWDRTSQKPD